MNRRVLEMFAKDLLNFQHEDKLAGNKAVVNRSMRHAQKKEIAPLNGTIHFETTDEHGFTQRGEAAPTPSPSSDEGEGRGEDERLSQPLWITPLLGPLPTPSSRGEEEKASLQIFAVTARTCRIVVRDSSTQYEEVGILPAHLSIRRTALQITAGGQRLLRRRAMKTHTLSRRSFLAVLGTVPLMTSALAAAPPVRKRIPIGIQMYSVRDDEKRDLFATLKGLREMGYECVEFWAPYFDWTPARARGVRKQLDDLGLRCYSNHTGVKHCTAEHLPHAIELNHILGSRYVIMAHAGPQPNLDGWKRTAEVLSKAHEQLKAAGITGESLAKKNQILLTISTTEDEILGIGGENVKGFFACMKYFQSLDNENNKKFVAAFKERWGKDAVIGDVTQAAYLGPWLWKLTVEKANSFDIDKVAAASPGVEFKEAPEGYVRIHANHHLWSKARIGEMLGDGQFKVLAESPDLIEPDPFPKGYQ